MDASKPTADRIAPLLGEVAGTLAAIGLIALLFVFIVTRTMDRKKTVSWRRAILRNHGEKLQLREGLAHKSQNFSAALR